MPSNCSIFGCYNTYAKTKGSKIKYHHFPKEKTYRDQWVHACSREYTINTENALVCSIHFKPQDYKDDMMSRLLEIESPKHNRLLREDAVPTLFLPDVADVVGHGSANDAKKKTGSRKTPKSLPSQVVSKERREKTKVVGKKLGNTTKKLTKLGLDILLEWLETNGLPKQFKTLPKEELDQLLARLYVEVQNKGAERFTKTAFIQLRNAIQKHLQGSPFNIDYVIKTDPAFSHSNKILQDLEPQLCPLLSHELRHLVKTGTLGMHNPNALQNLVWLSMALHFGNLSSEEWLTMTKYSIVRSTDERGFEYVGWSGLSTKSNLSNSSTASSKKEDYKMYASPQEPLCPVKAFDMYMSLLNPEIDKLWQKPNAAFEKTKQWYCKQVVGKRTIMYMMKNMCLQAKLNEKHVNNCLRVTSSAILMEADIQESDIFQVSDITGSINTLQKLPKEKEGETWNEESAADCFEDLVTVGDIPSPDVLIKCEDIKIEDEDPLAVPASADLSYDDDDSIPPKRCRLESDGYAQENTDKIVAHVDDGLSHQHMTDNPYEDMETETYSSSLRDSSPTSVVEDESLETHQATENSATLQNSQPLKEFQKKDIYDDFASQIAKTLRDLNDENTFRRVQIEINNILLEALSGKYKSPDHSEKQISRVLSQTSETPVLVQSNSYSSPLVCIINPAQVAQNQVNSECLLQNSVNTVQTVQSKMNMGQILVNQVSSVPVIQNLNPISSEPAIQNLNPVTSGPVIQNMNSVSSGPVLQKPFSLEELVNNPMSLWQMSENPQTPGKYKSPDLYEKQISRVLSKTSDTPVVVQSNSHSAVLPVHTTYSNSSPLMCITHPAQVGQNQVNSECVLQNSVNTEQTVQSKMNTGQVVVTPVSSGPVIQNVNPGSSGPVIQNINSVSSGPVIQNLNPASSGPVIQNLNPVTSGPVQNMNSVSSGAVLQKPFNLGQLVNNPMNLWQMIKNPQTPGQVYLKPINLRQMSQIAKNMKQDVQQPGAARQVNLNPAVTTFSAAKQINSPTASKSGNDT